MIKQKENLNRRVVVTGLGVVSSLGIGWQEFWKNLSTGKSGISRITGFDTSQYERHFAGEIKNFDPAQFMTKKKAAQLGRASQLAIAASRLAIKDGGFKKSDLLRTKTGVCIGTTMGEPQVMEKLDEKCYPGGGRLDVDFGSAMSYPANSISNCVAHDLKLTGNNVIFSNACAAGNYAVGYAFDLIRYGETDVMLAGGVDALSRIAFTGFSRLFAMAPEKCQPFDKNRKGMLLGEGAGILLLERLDSALKRKAPIYAEILGYGMSCDAQHMTIPSVEGISGAIERCSNNAKINLEEIDYISAHGTGTLENDKAECEAYGKVFGESVNKIPVSAIKSMLGHTMGAAAALAAASCCLAIKEGVIPPTINLEEQDPDCRIDCVPNKGRKRKVQTALNNSQAFGGNNACVLLRNIN